MKIKKVVIIFLLFMLFSYVMVLQKSFATAEKLESFPDLPTAEKVEFDKFWTLIDKLDFETALQQGQKLQVMLTSNAYKKIVNDISELIKSKLWSNKKLLREFILLERNRLYWQEYNWWPQNYQYNDAMEDVNKILSGFENILRKHPKSDIEDEVLFRLGLCYSSMGELGLQDFEKAIEIFNELKLKYPNSNLVDDADYEIIGIKRMNGQIFNETIINLLKKFITHYPESNKLINARYDLAFYYRMTSNYTLAVKEYLTIVQLYPKEKEKVLESLKELTHIYRYDLKDVIKEREILRMIIEKFPNTLDSKLATDRLRDLRSDDSVK